MKFPKALSFIQEVLIIFLLILTFNNLLGRFDEVIVSDGVGYYDYNPSFFIFDDLNRYQFDTSSNSEVFSRVRDIGSDIYIDYHGKPLNKYAVGTGILQMPFFIFANILTNGPKTGYEAIFQDSIFAATLFYLFLTLVFFRLLLSAYKIRSPVILFSQICLVFGTSLTHYCNAEASFSHVYSLFAITAFLFFIKRLIDTNAVKYIYYSAIFFSLVLLIRPLNGIVIFAIPFITGSFESTKSLISLLWIKLNHIIFSLLIVAAIVSIQFIVWYFQTGDWLLYSYQGEGFNFFHPQFLNILFSFRKGLFIYTPLMLLPFFAVIYLSIKNRLFIALSWLGFFVLVTYVLSSWWSWYYGVSYGLRAYIDFYTILLIPFAIVLNDISRGFKILFIITAIACISLNLVQDYQYTNYILDGYTMNFEKYKRVFLKTGEQYSGLVSKRIYDYSKLDTIAQIELSDISIEPNTSLQIGNWNVDSLTQLSGATIIQISFRTSFHKEMNSRCQLFITNVNTDMNIFAPSPFVINFAEKESTEIHKGLYNFEIDDVLTQPHRAILISFYTRDLSLDMKDFIIYFLKPKL